MDITEDLSTYVRRVLHIKRLTAFEVSQRTQGRISQSYISNIVTGQHCGLTIRKLKILAQGLSVSEDELFAVARGKLTPGNQEFTQSKFFELYNLYKQLPPKDQHEVGTLLNMLEHEIEWRRAFFDTRGVVEG